MKTILEKLKSLKPYQKALFALLVIFMVVTDAAILFKNIIFMAVGLVLTITLGFLLYKSCKK